jgi:hypothetical protein
MCGIEVFANWSEADLWSAVKGGNLGREGSAKGCRTAKVQRALWSSSEISAGQDARLYVSQDGRRCGVADLVWLHVMGKNQSEPAPEASALWATGEKELPSWVKSYSMAGFKNQWISCWS